MPTKNHIGIKNPFLNHTNTGIAYITIYNKVNSIFLKAIIKVNFTIVYGRIRK